MGFFGVLMEKQHFLKSFMSGNSVNLCLVICYSVFTAPGLKTSVYFIFWQFKQDKNF